MKKDHSFCKKCNKLCILSSSIRRPCQWGGMNTKQTKKSITYLDNLNPSHGYSFSILNLTFCQLLCHTAIWGDVQPFCIMYTPTIFRSHKKKTSRSRHYSLLAYSRQARSGSNIIVSFSVPHSGADSFMNSHLQSSNIKLLSNELQFHIEKYMNHLSISWQLKS